MEESETVKFAVKYRPVVLDDLVGQSSTISKVKYFLEKREFPNTMLITGNTGNGKTTLARIIAKTINNVENISELNDIYEINIGTNNTVDAISQIIAKLNYRPSSVNHKKIYIFDEVHTLTKTSASGLLKILEEPSKYNIFILCTNEPEKLLETLKNRCYKIILNTYSNNDIIDLLKKVCLKEDIKVSDENLDKISIASNNCPREALNILQDVNFQLKSNPNKEVNIESICSEIFNGFNTAYTLLNAFYNKDFATIFNIVSKAEECVSLLNFMYRANEQLMYLAFINDNSKKVDISNVSNFYFNMYNQYKPTFKNCSIVQEILTKCKAESIFNVSLKDNLILYGSKVCLMD